MCLKRFIPTASVIDGCRHGRCNTWKQRLRHSDWFVESVYAGDDIWRDTITLLLLLFMRRLLLLMMVIKKPEWVIPVIVTALLRAAPRRRYHAHRRAVQRLWSRVKIGMMMERMTRVTVMVEV